MVTYHPRAGELAAAVEQRRAQLGLTGSELARVAGIGRTTLERIITGQVTRPTRDVIGKLDAPLQWAPGTAWGILASAPTLSDNWQVEADAMKGLLAAITTLRRSMNSVLPEMNSGIQQAMNEVTGYASDIMSDQLRLSQADNSINGASGDDNPGASPRPAQ